MSPECGVNGLWFSSGAVKALDVIVPHRGSTSSWMANRGPFMFQKLVFPLEAPFAISGLVCCLLSQESIARAGDGCDAVLDQTKSVNL